MTTRIILLIFVFIAIAPCLADENDNEILEKCLQQIKPQGELYFDFAETKLILAHLSEPWKTLKKEIHGKFAINGDNGKFYYMDSVKRNSGYSNSYSYWSSNSGFTLGYGDTLPSKMTKEGMNFLRFGVAQYSPLFEIINLIMNKSELDDYNFREIDNYEFSYRLKEGNEVKLKISKDNYLPVSIDWNYHHTIFGDVVQSISYTKYEYSQGSNCHYPTMNKNNELGMELNKVNIKEANRSVFKDAIAEFETMDARAIDETTLPETVNLIRFNEDINLIEIDKADAQSMILEFEDYFVAIEAPLSPEIGEQIINKVKEINPKKPIKYFTYGHHHPHYLGGIRSFVANGTEIITLSQNYDYCRFIIDNSHTLKPDKLQMNPRKAYLSTFDSLMTISDSRLELQIIKIGALSDHTHDYLIYYIPKYKLLFEGDLVWIKNMDQIGDEASSRQKGLYSAIKMHKLEVETIIQSWPLYKYDVKSIITMEELMQSMITDPIRD